MKPDHKAARERCEFITIGNSGRHIYNLAAAYLEREAQLEVAEQKYQELVRLARAVAFGDGDDYSQPWKALRDALQTPSNSNEAKICP